jgi:hypothetical protein
VAVEIAAVELRHTSEPCACRCRVGRRNAKALGASPRRGPST